MKTGWSATTLGEIAEIVSGATPKTSDERFWNGDVLWATPKDLSDLDPGTTRISTTPRSLTAAGLQSCAAKLLPPGSVLLSSRAPIGLTAINDEPMATNQGFKSFVPDSSRVDSGFLLRWLRYNRPRIESLGNGATFKEISKKVTSAIAIELPPIEEQRRIAAVLDAADDLRTKRRQALAKLDTLTQAIFIDMFGGDWDRWPFVPVEELAEQRKGSMRTGPFGSQLLHEEFVEQGIAVLGIDNAVQNEFAWGERRYITEEKYEQLRRFTVFPGDVIVTIMGTCGRVAIVPEDIPVAINTKHLCCVTLDQDQCLSEWLWGSLLFHPRVLDQLGATIGAVMPGLNMGKIKQAEVPMPPLDEQRDFARAKARVATERHRNATSMRALDTLFASLQQRAFAGEL